MIAGCYILALILADFAGAASLPPSPYYSEKFYIDVSRDAGDAVIKENLFAILSRAHVPGEKHDELKENCSSENSCYQHSPLGYRRAREVLFGDIHLIKTAKGYGVRDVYCEILTSEGDFSSQPPGPGKIPNASILNTEHTWPQSRFSARFDTEMQKSDLHILFPVLSRANSSRSNLEFGDVVTITSTPCPKSKRGYTANGNSRHYFEVPDSHKGNAARAIFYFSIRYRMPISSAEEHSLRAWNRLDPVDTFERQRHEKIFAKQKVRNPFVDYPELADLLSDF